MIVIAVVASIVAYAWVMGYIGGQTQKTGNQIQIQSYTSQGNLIIYVQNTGQGTVHLKQDGSVYVNDVLKTIRAVDDQTCDEGAKIPISVGQTVKVEVNYDQYKPGDRIKVVTIEGTTMEVTGTGGSGTGNGNGNGGGSGQSYQVIFNLGSGGASMSPTGTQTYAAGTSVPLNAIAASGYQFSGWTTTGTISFDSASSASTNAHINGAGSITANFVQIQSGQNYQVQFILGTGGASMTPAAGSHTYPAGSSVPINAIAASGYQFSSWISTGTITFDSATSASTNAHIGSIGSITASFVATSTGQSYQVTFNLGTGGASMNPTGTQTYNGGSIVPVTATASSGYQFSAWTSTGTITFDSATSASTNAHINSDGTITANFVQTQSGQNYQVTFVLGTGGASITPTAGAHTYAAGASVQVSTTASSGYQFSGWSSTGTITFDSVSSASTSAHIGSDGTITANFAPIQTGQNYQVNFVLGTGGASMTPTAGSHTYPAGSSVNAHIGSAGSITASFVATSTGQSYQVTFNLGTGGASMNPTGTQTYAPGTSVPLTTTAASGYQFSSWSSSSGSITFDSASSSSTNAHIGSSGTITANFQVQSGQSYQVNFVVSPAGSGTTNPTVGTHTYNIGSTIPITATAGNGYTFSSWTHSGSDIVITNPNSASTNAQINGAGTITANFISTTGYKLVFTAGTSQTLSVYEPSARITVQRQDSAGNQYAPSSSLTVTLTTTTSTGKFYSDSACTQEITTSAPLRISSRQSSQNFYYRDSSTGTPTITASASSYQPVSTTFKVTAATPEIGLTTGFDGTPWDSEWRSWPNPPWSQDTTQYYSASSSATSISSNQGAFSSNKVDATGAAYITVSFYFRITGTDPTDFQIRWGATRTDTYDSITWHNLGVNLGDRNVYAANTWHYYSIDITDTSAFTDYFRFQFVSQSLSSNAQVWVDNVQIVVNK
jgi:hypothetical protein